MKTFDPADRDAMLYEETNLEDATLERLEMLFNLGAMIISKGKVNDTALHVAAKRGFDAKLGVLLKTGASIDLEDRYQSAAAKGFLR